MDSVEFRCSVCTWDILQTEVLRNPMRTKSAARVAVFVVVAFLAPVCYLYDDHTRIIMDLVGTA